MQFFSTPIVAMNDNVMLNNLTTIANSLSANVDSIKSYITAVKCACLLHISYTLNAKLAYFGALPACARCTKGLLSAPEWISTKHSRCRLPPKMLKPMLQHVPVMVAVCIARQC